MKLDFDSSGIQATKPTHMAEEFQNTISLHGPVDAVEEMARLIGMLLFKNLKSESTDEFIFLKNTSEEPIDVNDILTECLLDSVVFGQAWAKISLAFQTRRGSFPVLILTNLMRQFPEVYMEIQTLGDCSGLTGILAKEGKNLAIRRLDLGADCANLTSLFIEYHSFRVGFPTAIDPIKLYSPSIENIP
jgi:hypothetical protein